MMNNILSQLKKAKASREIVSIHFHPENQATCSVGYVDQLTKSKIRIYGVSTQGFFDGYDIRNISDIYRIDMGGNYEKKIELLRKNHDNIYSESELKNKIKGDDLMLTTLKEAKREKLVVAIWASDQEDSIGGYVDTIGKNDVRILSIDEYGQEDGFISITMDAIDALECNSRNCQKLGFLHDHFIRI